MKYPWILIAPWASLLLLPSFVFMAARRNASRRQAAAMLFPSTLAFCLTWAALPPNFSPAIPLLIVLNVTCSNKVLAVLRPTLGVIHYTLVAIVALTLSWMLAGRSYRWLSRGGMGVRVAVAVVGLPAALWLYFLPYEINQAMYGGGSGILVRPEWVLNMTHVTHKIAHSPWLSHGLGPINLWQLFYLAGVAWLLLAWSQEPKPTPNRVSGSD